MTTALWVAVAVLIVVAAFLVVALNGATRTVADLRRQLDGRETDARETDEPVRPASGLPIGTAAPPISGAPAGRHLLVFVEPGCGGCEMVVPPLLAAEGLPPLVLVGRVQDGWPESWRSPATVVFDTDESIGDAYEIGFTPHAVVVDEGGSIAAQGPVDGLDMVHRLLREAEGVRIVRAEVRRGE